MISLEDLRNATGGQLFGRVAAAQFPDFCHDVRRLEPGQLFVAIKTGYSDGHHDIESAIAGGAGGVLCQEPPTCDVTGATVILVGDTVAALGQWAAYVLRRYDTTVIGVLGTLGKSSTREAIATVLRGRYRVYNNPDALPGRAGIPLGLGGLVPEHQIALVELVSDFPGEMADLLAIAQPHIGIITNIATGAAQDVGDLERRQLESLLLLDALPPDGSAVLNRDDVFVRAMLNRAQSSIMTYGLEASTNSPDFDLAANNVQFYVDKTGFDVQHRNTRLKGCLIPTLGRPGLYAALVAFSVGVLFDISLKDSLQALSNLRALPGRLSLLDGTRGSLLIDDTFDATPASTSAALELLSTVEAGQGRRIFVLGDMRSQAETAEQAHRDIGQMSANLVDLLITCGDLASVAGRAARQAGLPPEQTALAYRHDDAANIVRNFTRQGDIVLVTGGRQSRMERVCGQLLSDAADRTWLPRQHDIPGGIASLRPTWPSWIELDLDAIAHNIRAIRRRINPNVRLIALVEANGYGHGAAHIASTAVNNGADMLGVASPNEGYLLRQAGIEAPILVLGYTPAWEVQQAVLNDLTVTIYDRDNANVFDRTAHELKRVVRVHVRVDAGLGQAGLLPDDVIPLVRSLVRLDSTEIEGLYTHFSLVADPSEIAYTREELARFTAVVTNLRASGLTIPYIHAAGSAALLTLPESHFTAVRAGLIMYGVAPSLHIPCPPDFRRALNWKTHITQLKTLPAGWFVGYGNIYQAEAEEQIAVIPVGYADGFRDPTQNEIEVLIRGQRAPVIGRTAMSQSVVYVSHIPDVRTGDEVVLIGRQGAQEIRVEELADCRGTSYYELLTGISSRIPRLV